MRAEKPIPLQLPRSVARVTDVVATLGIWRRPDNRPFVRDRSSRVLSSNTISYYFPYAFRRYKYLCSNIVVYFIAINHCGTSSRFVLPNRKKKKKHFRTFSTIDFVTFIYFFFIFSSFVLIGFFFFSVPQVKIL